LSNKNINFNRSFRRNTETVRCNGVWIEFRTTQQ